MTEKQELDFEMKDEYDFSNARPNPYATKARMRSNLIAIDTDLIAAFPNSEAVNEALRLVLRAAELATRNQAQPSSKAS